MPKFWDINPKPCIRRSRTESCFLKDDDMLMWYLCHNVIPWWNEYKWMKYGYDRAESSTSDTSVCDHPGSWKIMMYRKIWIYWYPIVIQDDANDLTADFRNNYFEQLSPCVNLTTMSYLQMVHVMSSHWQYLKKSYKWDYLR